MNRSSHFANISGLAYKPFNDKLTEKLKKLGYKKIKYLNKDGAQAMILTNNTEQVLAFRGTQPKELNDIAADLKSWKMKSKTDGEVHDGFYDEVEKLWADIIPLISATKPLFITGHSLGGAMATIAASRLEKQTECLYTFGSPRVGNKKFIDHVLVKHYRWRNNNDLVPTVPFFIMGFRHHGTFCYLNSYGKLRNGMSLWQRFKDKMRGHWQAIKKFELADGFRDHGIAHYIKHTKNSNL
jgi:triacylglycerol lipase